MSTLRWFVDPNRIAEPESQQAFDRAGAILRDERRSRCARDRL
jgi:hypothetical protein